MNCAVKLADTTHGIVAFDVAGGTDAADCVDTAEDRDSGFIAQSAEQLISDLRPNSVGAIDTTTLDPWGGH